MNSTELLQCFRTLPCRLLAILFLGGLIGCASPRTVSTPAPEETTVQTVAVLPFKDMYRIYGADMAFRCPLCGRATEIAEVQPDADLLLTDRLMELLGGLENYRLIEPSQAEPALMRLVAEEGKSLSERDLIVETGLALNADAVLAGYLYRYQERLGNEYSIERPASVSFSLYLIRVSDGRITWMWHFDETQKSLDRNLFDIKTFLKRKGKWITAEEMATAGLQEAVTKFQGLQ